MTKTSLLSLLLFAAIMLNASAQELKENLKFGKPTNEELTMTTYADDPNAEAVILFEKTHVSYVINASGFNVVTDFKTRIKVLKQEGVDYANVELNAYDPRSNINPATHERISKVEATAYNMEGGKLVTTKMKGNLVVKQRIDDYHVVTKFAVPQVKVGTVIEYSYSIQSDNIYSLRDWYAQCEIPVFYTMYDLTYPEFLGFSVEMTDPTHKLTSRKEIDNQNYSLGGEVLLSRSPHYTVVGRNLPALKSDGSIWCVNDYRAKVTAELNSISLPSQRRNFTDTWESIATLLSTDDQFGGRLKKQTSLSDEMKNLNLDALPNIEEKVMAIYKLLMSKVKWDETYEFYSSKKESTLLKDGSGSNADINFVLINMLNSAGINAYPVLLRLRHNGQLPFTHPSIKKLNTFVVGVDTGDGNIAVIDGSAQTGYLNAINPNLMPSRAMLLNQGDCKWIDLSALCKGREGNVLNSELKPDGTLVGNASISYGNVSSYIFKNSIEGKEQSEIADKLGERMNATISDLTIIGTDEISQATTENYQYEMKCQKNDDIIYVNPFVLSIWTENPYTAETREVPIERILLITEDWVSNITIPEGYDVEEMPKPLTIHTADNGLSCTIRYRKNGNQLVATYKYKVNKMSFDAEEYADLRSVYEQIIAKCGEMVAVKKL